MDDVPREEYIHAIIDLLQKCYDIELLDFILQLLQKIIK